MLLGETVLYTFPANCANPNAGHSNRVPAIVTAQWSETCVNLRVLQDGSANPLWLTSVNRRDASNEADGNYWEPRAAPQAEPKPASAAQSDAPSPPPPGPVVQEDPAPLPAAQQEDGEQKKGGRGKK